MSFCPPAEMLIWYSPIRMGELCSNDQESPLSYTALLTDATLQGLLDGTAGDILAATRVAQRYTLAQLDALAANARLGAMLRRLNADLTAVAAVGRKMIPAASADELVPRAALALLQLQQLRDGERIFDTADGLVAEAGANVKSLSSPWTPNPFQPCLLSDDSRIFGTVRPPWPFPGRVGGGRCGC